MSESRHRPRFDVVAIVGSQGARPAAERILGALPADFPASVIYVQHRLPSGDSILIELLRRRVSLPVHSVGDGDLLLPGTVHVLPAGVETVLDAGGRFAQRPGRCNGDPLLATVAEVYGPRSIGVVLSGRLDDGAVGLRRIKGAGGRCLVQSPDSADAPSMPLAALATGCYDFVLDPRGIAAALVAFVSVAGAADLLGVRSHPVLAG